MQGGVQSALGLTSGLAGFAEQRGSVGLIKQGLQFDLRKVKTYADDVAGLRKKGFSQAAIDQIIQAGGAQTASVLNHASKADAQQINSLLAQTQAQANRVGQYAADPKLTAEVAATSRSVATLARAVDSTNKRLDKLGDTVYDAQVDAMRDFVRGQIKAHQKAGAKR